MKKLVFNLYSIAMIAFFLLPGVVVAANDLSSDKEEASKAAHKWEFMLMLGESNHIEADNDYLFGIEASKLKEMIQEMYVTREEVIPGDPTTRTVIRKPSIYQSVKSIEKYLRKEVSGKRLSKERATELFSHVERTALAAIDSNGTESFEDALDRSKKSPSDLLSIYKQVKLVDLN